MPPETPQLPAKPPLEPTHINTGNITNSAGVAIGPGAVAIVHNNYEAPKLRIPLQRPPRAEHFTGRQAELAQLLTSLQPGKVITLCGPGGMGKSALAAEAVWQLAPDDDPPDLFPAGIIFHSFYNQSQVAIALEHIARTFGEELKPTPKEAAQRALAGRKALLILDGAEQADDLRQIVDIRDQCAILITSRQRKDAPATRQDLSPLPPDDALSLLRAWGGKRAHDPSSLQRISDWVGRLPLALRLVGRYLDQSEEDASDYVTWLAQTPLSALDHGQRQLESVPLLLERSLAQLSKTARQVMGVVGILALAPFSRAAIAAALNWPESETRQALATLVDYGMLHRPGDTYKVTHALIYTYARERLSPPTKLVIALADHFQQTIQQHQSDFSPIGKLHPHITVLLRVASEREAWNTVIALALSIDTYLDLQGYWWDRILTIEAAVIAAQITQNRPSEGAWIGNLGNAYAALGQVKQAIGFYQRALVIAKQIGDRRGESTTQSALGTAYYSLGQVERAISHYQRSLDIAKEIGDHSAFGNALGNLGLAYADLGQHKQAINSHQQSLDIARGLNDRRAESAQLGNLGLAYVALGQLEKAIDYYQQALDIAKEIGDRSIEGIVLGNLGLVYAYFGQIDYSISYYQQALAITKEIRDRRNEGAHLGNLGLVHHIFGQVEQALSHYQQALNIAKEIGDRSAEGNALGNLGTAYRDLGQIEQASQCWQDALCIFEDLKLPNADKIRHSLSSLQPKNP